MRDPCSTKTGEHCTETGSDVRRHRNGKSVFARDRIVRKRDFVFFKVFKVRLFLTLRCGSLKFYPNRRFVKNIIPNCTAP